MQILREPFKELIGEENLVGVEIGVAKGRNSESILYYLNIDKLYLIDPYKQYSETRHGVPPQDAQDACLVNAKERLSGYGNSIVWLQMLSGDAVNHVNEELDFVYIDGNHRYEYVKNDIELYYPLVKKGGLISGHDYGSSEPGVEKAVHEFFGELYINTKDTNWWLIK